MICTSMLIATSTQLTKFLVRVATKTTAPSLCWRPGAYASSVAYQLPLLGRVVLTSAGATNKVSFASAHALLSQHLLKPRVPG